MYSTKNHLVQHLVLLIVCVQLLLKTVKNFKLFCSLSCHICFIRLLVSASQDGKLIIWDSYTTNKVITPDMSCIN